MTTANIVADLFENMNEYVDYTSDSLPDFDEFHSLVIETDHPNIFQIGDDFVVLNITEDSITRLGTANSYEQALEFVDHFKL